MCQTYADLKQTTLRHSEYVKCQSQPTACHAQHPPQVPLMHDDEAAHGSLGHATDGAVQLAPGARPLGQPAAYTHDHFFMFKLPLFEGSATIALECDNGQIMKRSGVCKCAQSDEKHNAASAGARWLAAYPCCMSPLQCRSMIRIQQGVACTRQVHHRRTIGHATPRRCR
jgi:hypothetical protein